MLFNHPPQCPHIPSSALIDPKEGALTLLKKAFVQETWLWTALHGTKWPMSFQIACIPLVMDTCSSLALLPEAVHTLNLIASH